MSFARPFTRDLTSFYLLPWKLSAHLRMGFFLHQQTDLTRFLRRKSYTAL